MKVQLKTRVDYLLVILFTLVLFSCKKEITSPESTAAINSVTGIKSPSAAPTMSVFATGLINPRGLKFGPDGYLYVAEGGTGGTNTTTCTQVIPPVGPYTGSTTGGRISRISPEGVRTTLTSSLPSSETSAALGHLISGVGDVAFIGNTLYAVLAGAGCSHGVQGIPNGVVKVNMDGSWNMIANLSAWQQAHPVQNPEPDDFEPDGTWYSMIALRGDLYAVEPNHGEMVKVTTDGQISRVIDVSATQGHIVPTAVAYHGNFFLGNLYTFPVVAGSSNIYKVTPSGQIMKWATGLTTVVGLAFDAKGRMYVLENTTVSGPGPTPGTGKVVRVSENGNVEDIATGLSLPTAMTFGPDGKLYVSNWGFGPPPIGIGEIMQITIPD